MIKLKDYNEKEHKLSIVSDIPLSLANAIRRSVLEIPILAIDEVEIIKNDSALYDEIIAHRMGLIPIKTDKLSKEIKFKLKESGPKIVYSSYLTPSVDTEYKLPIVILDKEQEIEVIAEAKLGKGIDHIKHSPGLLYYNYDIDEDLVHFVSVGEEGKISYDEEDIKNKISEEKLNRIKKLKNSENVIIYIESWGQIKTKEIFTKAIDALNENLEEINKIL